MKALIKTFWPEYLYLGLIAAVVDLGVRIIQPFMLGGMLDYFKPGSSSTSLEDALWYAGAIASLNFVSTLLMNQYILGVFHGGMKIRAACCALIYRKVCEVMF